MFVFRSFCKYDIFILSGGRVTGLCFLDIRRDVVFVGLKSTNHEVAHLIIKSILRLRAADWIFNNNAQAGVISKEADR